MLEYEKQINQAKTKFYGSILVAIGSIAQASLIVAFGFRYTYTPFGGIFVSSSPDLLQYIGIFIVFPIFLAVILAFLKITPTKLVIDPRGLILGTFAIILSVQILLPVIMRQTPDIYGLMLNTISLMFSGMAQWSITMRITGLAILSEPLYKFIIVKDDISKVQEVLDDDAIAQVLKIGKRKTVSNITRYRTHKNAPHQLFIFLQIYDKVNTAVRFVSYRQDDFSVYCTEADKLAFENDLDFFSKMLKERKNLALANPETDSYDKDLAIGLALSPVKSKFENLIRVPMVGAIIALALIAFAAIIWIKISFPKALDDTTTYTLLGTVLFFGALQAIDAFRSQEGR